MKDRQSLDADSFTSLPGRQVALAMVCVVAALFLAAISQTVIAATMPLIVAELGGFDRYAWAAAAYLVSATVTFPIVGRLSDVYGRRRFLVLGLAAFVAGSALVGLSRSMNQVIAFRAFQGVGGGMITTCCYIAIADLFAPENRGKYHGIIGAVYGFASIIGPFLGGMAAERFTWEWPFFLIALAGVPVLGLTARIYPAPRPSGKTAGIDLPGMVTLVLAVVALTLALSMGGADVAGGPSLPVGLLAFGLAMTAVFVYIEVRSEAPIMPMEVLADRVVVLSVVVMLLTSFGLYGTVFFLPPFAQIVLGVSVADSAALLLPILLGTVGGGILAGQLLSRTGTRYRLQAAGNAAIMLAGTVLTLTIDADTNRSLIGLCMALTGFGFGGLVSTFSIAVQNMVPFRLVGAATSALQFHRSLGGMAGLAVLGGLLSRRFTAQFDRTVSDRVRSALPADRLEALRKDPVAQFDRTVSDRVRSALPADRLEALRKDPVALVEPATAADLRFELAGTGADLADTLLESLHAAFVLAMGDVFIVVAVLTAVAVGVALLFRVPAHAADRTHESAAP